MDTQLFNFLFVHCDITCIFSVQQSYDGRRYPGAKTRNDHETRVGTCMGDVKLDIEMFLLDRNHAFHRIVHLFFRIKPMSIAIQHANRNTKHVGNLRLHMSYYNGG